jgi:gamma-glutamyltranspeptidase/glutathione hydrolase
MNGTRPTVASLHGMVAAAHPLAAQAGAKLLAAGGNAFDAAAATAAALNVVEPFMSGIAGVGVAICYVAAEKRVRALDFVTRVPAQFPTGRFSRRDELFRGPLACAAAGCLAGWHELVATYGRRKLPEIFAPAVALARDGHPVIEFAGACLRQSVQTLEHLPFFEDWRATYVGNGIGAPGFVMRQPELARSLETIAFEGPDHLYRGDLGRRIVAHVQALGGCLTMDDLRAVKPVWSEPLAAGYRGLQVHTPPPPCEGFQYLLTLRILDGFDLAAMERGSVAHLDTVWRAIRLAAGARIAHNKPNAAALTEIFSDAHVEALRARVRDGAPIDGLTEQWAPPGTIHAPDPHAEHTTSFSVADRDGNVVCVTQSLGGLFGCGVVVPGTGICLNNFLYWGELDPHGANRLVPGLEFALPLAPSVALREGRPVLALGTPGSYGISQTQTQTLVQHVDFGRHLQDAIEAPRARLWDGRRVQAEGRIDAGTLEGLRARGHEVEALVDWTMLVGGLHGIALDPATGVMIGGADPRRDGVVAVP